jgi:hypothetical protein
VLNNNGSYVPLIGRNDLCGDSGIVTTDDLVRFMELNLGVRNIGKHVRSSSGKLYASITSAIRKGTLPHLDVVEGLRRAARLSLGSVYWALGVNLDRLAWLRAHLNTNRTRPAPNSMTLPGTPVLLPARLGPVERPYTTMPLSRIVTHWCRQPIGNLLAWRRQACLYAQVGLQDGISYPVVPPGAMIQIDPRFTTIQGVSDPHFYFVRQPYGYSCCRCAVEKGTIFLLPSSRLYPQLEFAHPGVVQVIGRVRAICGRIDRVVPPAAKSLRQLKSRRELMERSPADLAQSPLNGQELLRNQRLCLGVPYEELDQATELMRSLPDEFGRFHISNGHAHKIEHFPNFVPTVPTLCALTAYYGLDYSDTLAAYGVDVDDSQTLDLSAVKARFSMTELAMHVGFTPFRSDFASMVLDHWLEWPSLLCQLAPDLPVGKIFFFAGNSGIEPLLKPASFLLVDDSQTTVPTATHDHNTATLTGWERPLYMYYLREKGFVAGYAEREGRRIHLVAHPQAADRRQNSFVPPDQGEVIGRITAVATLL